MLILHRVSVPSTILYIDINVFYNYNLNIYDMYV